MDVSIAVGALSVLEKLAGLLSGLRKENAKEVEGLIELLRTKLELLQAENGRMEEKVRRLEKEIAELESQETKGLRWYRGLRFRVLPSGRMDRAVFCPNCKATLCRWMSSDYDVTTGVAVNIRHAGIYACNMATCKWSSEDLGMSLDTLLQCAAREHGVELVG